MLTNPWLHALLWHGAALAFADANSWQPALGCLVVGLGMIGLAAVPRTLEWPPPYRWSWACFLGVRFHGRIALREAAQMLREIFRSDESFRHMAAEHKERDRASKHVLDFAASCIASAADIWGKRGAEGALVLIDSREVCVGVIRGGATQLELRDEVRTSYTDLQIRVGVLDEVFSALRAELHLYSSFWHPTQGDAEPSSLISQFATTAPHSAAPLSGGMS